METRNEKFRRLAVSRMTQLFADMNTIANLTNTQRYEATQADLDELLRKYLSQGKASRSYFESTKTPQAPLLTSFVYENHSPAKNQKKHALFRKISAKRMDKVFDDARLLANLSNKSNYTYKAYEIDWMFGEYEKKGYEVYQRFMPLSDYFSFDKY